MNHPDFKPNGEHKPSSYFIGKVAGYDQEGSIFWMLCGALRLKGINTYYIKSKFAYNISGVAGWPANYKINT